MCVCECVFCVPVLLLRFVKGLSVALALEVQLAVLDPKELEDRDLPRLSELTFLVLFVAVLLQSAKEGNPNTHVQKKSYFCLTVARQFC